MPNYFAHLYFGSLVLAALPEGLRARLEAEQGAYILGQYGPDPLFFYHPAVPNAPCELGHRMHREPPRTALERLRQAVELGLPGAAGYAAGFLCHFALDSRCHGYVLRRTAEGGVTHAGLESEFDRFLMVRDGVDPFRETPLPAPALPEGIDAVLEHTYPGVKARQFWKGMGFYQRVSRWYTKLAGRKIAKRSVDRAAKSIPALAFFQDALLPRSPRPEYQESSRALWALLQAEVAPAAEQMTAFFNGEPMGEWFDRDFSGRSFPADAP